MSARVTPYMGYNGFALGQTHTTTHSTVHATVTQNDIIQELNNRGYKLQVVHEVHEPVHVFALSRAQAIMIAVDEGIEQANLPRAYTHPYTCPSGTCEVAANVWNALIPWCVDIANGLLQGRYAMPAWFKEMMGLHGLAGTYGLGGFSDWLQENSWVVTAIGAALATYGQYLTAKEAREAIKQNVPKDLLTKENVAALVAELQNQGQIPAGKTDTVAQGAIQATSPSWLIPVMIGAGVLVVMMMMRK